MSKLIYEFQKHFNDLVVGQLAYSINATDWDELELKLNIVNEYANRVYACLIEQYKPFKIYSYCIDNNCCIDVHIDEYTVNAHDLLMRCNDVNCSEIIQKIPSLFNRF